MCYCQLVKPQEQDAEHAKLCGGVTSHMQKSNLECWLERAYERDVIRGGAAYAEEWKTFRQQALDEIRILIAEDTEKFEAKKHIMEERERDLNDREKAKAME